MTAANEYKNIRILIVSGAFEMVIALPIVYRRGCYFAWLFLFFGQSFPIGRQCWRPQDSNNSSSRRSRNELVPKMQWCVVQVTDGGIRSISF